MLPSQILPLGNIATPSRRRPRQFWRFAVAAIGLLASTGCSRGFWRKQADLDVYEAETQHLNDTRWAIPRIDVTANPESRFFDPFNPDCLPLPPDDSAAHAYMHWVDGWQGYKGWHKFGDTLRVENPQWLAKYGISDDQIDPLTGRFLCGPPKIENVSVLQAVELSQIHSRDYQFNLEAMYLAALDVTFERFQFGVRYLGINGVEPTASATATVRPGRVGDVTAGAAFGVSQLLPAGGQWAVELANNTVWLFSGGNQTNSASILSFSLVQPLLANAGRKVVLENLTQSERILLYETRELARFRQQLFVDVVGGPSGSGGYLGLMQTLQSVRNEEGNLERVRRQVRLLDAVNEDRPNVFRVDLAQLPDGLVIPPDLQGQLSYDAQRKLLIWIGSMEPDQEQRLRELSPDPNFQEAISSIIIPMQTQASSLDVLQLKTSYTGSLQRKRNLDRQYQDQLDNYKVQLGLPPDLIMTIDDTPLNQFELISGDLQELEGDVQDLLPQISTQIDFPPDGEPVPAGQEYIPSVAQLKTAIDKYEGLAERLLKLGSVAVETDLNRRRDEFDLRLSQSASNEERERLQSDFERDVRILGVTQAELDKQFFEIARWRKRLQDPEITPEARQQVRDLIFKEQQNLLRVTRNFAVLMVGVRVELIRVRDFSIPIEDAVALGVENRLDLMNSRAQVMDARRQIEIAANLLQSNLDVVVDGGIGTSGGNRPFDFRRDQSTYRFGLRFTAPLDQILERNTYRETLINYERLKRAYMLAEDTVKQQIRRDWRQLDTLRQNLDTSKQQIRLAAAQYDVAVDEALRPKQVGQANSRGTGLQGNNLLQALNSILNAQNTLIQNWVEYERNRLNIHRDMGIMDVGEDGVWNDPFYRDQRIFNNEPDVAGELVIPEPAPAGATSLDDPDGSWDDATGRRSLRGLFEPEMDGGF